MGPQACKKDFICVYICLPMFDVSMEKVWINSEEALWPDYLKGINNAGF